MCFRVSSVVIAVLLAVVCASFGGAGHATTVMASAVPLENAVPGRTVCHWSIPDGGLYVRGSDAFADMCHCDVFCAAYAQRPEPSGKALRARGLPVVQRNWGRMRSASVRGPSVRAAFGFRSTLFGQNAMWGRCNLKCWRATIKRGSVRVVRVETPVQPVGLPRGLWTLLLGLSLMALCGGRALGVARPARVPVRST